MDLEKLPLAGFVNLLLVNRNTFFLVHLMLNSGFPSADLIKRIPVLGNGRASVFVATP